MIGTLAYQNDKSTSAHARGANLMNDEKGGELLVKTVLVDFNHVDIDGLIVASQKHASSTLYIGDMVLAIESPGYNCVASVAVAESNGIVRLVLDPTHWRDELVAA